jgi:L-amino acid N-acyltransferase YncA
MTHGQETREQRKERSKASAELAVLEQAGHVLGFMSGPRTRGRKPAQMDEVLPELQTAVRKLLLRG